MFLGWKPHVKVAARRKKAAALADRLRKKGQALAPVAAAAGRRIVSTFWGKAWCDNLERYSDFANRLPRGRTYLRNGSVIDLQIGASSVVAKVMGSSLYHVTVKVMEVPGAHWQAIGNDCSSSIDSLVGLLQGQLSPAVMERICKPGTGLFPSPAEIRFDCSCPDSAAMCKHVAAVFYGIGARLDAQPELLFTLRGVDAKDLVARAGKALPLGQKEPRARRVLADSKLSELFGIEMAESDGEADADASARVRGKSVRTKSRAPAARKKKASGQAARARR
ncbi:MAG: SWIM zinc finger family protein [Gammaproteobacteria bacterium]